MCPMPFLSRSRAQVAWILAAGLLLVASDTPALTYVVGSGSGCTHQTIQAAVDAAAAQPGADTIRITTAAHLQQAVKIQGQALTIRGGYETCTSPTPLGRTEINGAGGERNSVITITGTGNDIRLENLLIAGGDEVDTDDGGGVDFAAGGSLYLTEVEISGNRAYSGGGLAVRSYYQASATLGPNVRIIGNTALGSGGGISVQYGSLKAESDNLLIAFNSALDGYGGGVEVRHTTRVDIGSPGFGNLPAILGNEAKYGGGIAVIAGTLSAEPALVRLYTTDATRPVGLRGNSATHTGGAVFLRPYFNVDLNNATATLCASDFRIDDNVAIQGPAIYADSDYSLANDLRSSQALLNLDGNCEGIPARPTSARRCTGHPDCNLISDNFAQGDASPANGAVILLQNAGYLDARNLHFRDNVGGHLIRAFGAADDGTGRRAAVILRTCLMTDNIVSREMLRLEDDRVSLTMEHCTLANNAMSGASLLRFGNASETRLALRRSVIWQPGIPVRAGTLPGTIEVGSVLSHEFATLPGATDAVQLNPRFVDPANGDYELRAASPAVDYVSFAGTDLHGRPRNVDLPFKSNRSGASDIGALERQTLLPLVLNADFDADLGLWTPASSGVSSWDPTFNTSGIPGSGSIKVTQANSTFGQIVNALTQCVHVPGPGVYALNGWGRGTGSMVVAGDYAQMHWDFRRSGGENCTGGAANASGDLILSNRSTWLRAPNPALISVSAADWTSTSSITVTLVVVENSLTAPRTANGWFDGITLEPLGYDTIFRNGFDP